MSPKHRIFVSATTRDLASYRELASRSLRMRRSDYEYEVVVQSELHLTYLQIHEKLKRLIAAHPTNPAAPTRSGSTTSRASWVN
jgi:hypothetical protein